MGSGLAAVELVPHPESDVRPLALEEVLAGLCRYGSPLSYELVHDGRYVRLFFVGPAEVLRQLVKSLKAVFGKVIVEGAEPPSLRGVLPSGCFATDGRGRVRLGGSCGWWVAELRLTRPFWDVLLDHSRGSPVELNHVDAVLAAMRPGTYVQVIFVPEPGGRDVIASWIHGKLTGESPSLVKAFLDEVLDTFSPAALGDSVDYRYERERYRYLRRQQLLELEKDRVRQARLKMASPLFAVRIRVYGPDREAVGEVANSFNQFSGNGFTFRVRKLTDKDLEVAERRVPVKLGWLIKDKKLPVLSARELAAFVNLPTPSASLPLRTGYVSLEPPPELVRVGPVRPELSVEELRGMVAAGIVLLGTHGDFGYGLPLREFRQAHKAIFGTTGAGKSSFARYLMLSTLLAFGPGRVSVVYIDPNGDDSIKLLKSLPEEFLDRVVYIDPRTAEFFGRVVRLNFLEYSDPRERPYLVEAFMGALENFFGRFWGPRTERFMRMAVELVTSAPPGRFSVADVYRVFTDESVRAEFLEFCGDEEVQHFFSSELPAMLKRSPEALQSVLNKLGKFVNDKLVRPFVTARKSTVSLREALDSGKVVIVNMGALKGTSSMQFFGSMLLSQVLLAAFSRGLRGEAARTPVFMFVDELHNFVSPALARTLASLMAETRKFGVFLIAMTQYPQQLPPRLRAAIYELARHVFVFQVGLESAKELAKVFEPYLGDADLMNIDFYHYAARVKLGGMLLRPFTLRAPYVPAGIEGNPYTEDREAVERMGRSLRLYGGEVSESGGPAAIRPVFGPRPYLVAATLHGMGGEAGVEDLMRALRGAGLAGTLLEAADLIGEAVREGAVRLDGDRAVLSDEALRALSIEFPETRHSGGELHRRLVREVAEELLRRRNYVWVDTTGSREAPDVVAVPASRDLSEWLVDRAVCYEVESDPVRHATFDKLVQVLRRCFRAGCSRVVIVTPGEAGADVIEERLGAVRKRARRVAVAAGIPEGWVRDAEVEVVVRPVKGGGGAPDPSGGAGGAADPGGEFLAWLRENYDRLSDSGLIGEYGGGREWVLVTAAAVREFRDRVGVKLALKDLPELLPGSVYRSVWFRGRAVRAVLIPAETLK